MEHGIGNGTIIKRMRDTAKAHRKRYPKEDIDGFFADK